MILSYLHKLHFPKNGKRKLQKWVVNKTKNGVSSQNLRYIFFPKKINI